ncbi:jg2143 [Pararge aegeria aegeria]|uniref:Jg2143 protein n=1 Tax=Pararge aegeria aegeria TaxID=348720 RepID=A0A8S4RYA1_9NEOP|nr:jg2143 [Pararge aegeria aegeria]
MPRRDHLTHPAASSYLYRLSVQPAGGYPKLRPPPILSTTDITRHCHFSLNILLAILVPIVELDTKLIPLNKPDFAESTTFRDLQTKTSQIPRPSFPEPQYA